MVLGTPTQGTPRSMSSSEMDCVSSPPRAMSASSLLLLDVGETLLEAAFDLLDVSARGAKDGAAALEDAAGGLEVERHRFVVDDAAPAFHEADELIAVVVDAFAHNGANDGVQAGAVSASGKHSNPHC